MELFYEFVFGSFFNLHLKQQQQQQYVAFRLQQDNKHFLI